MLVYNEPMADFGKRDMAANEDSFSVLKSIGEASVVSTALVFVAGWSYLAAYYKTFGLNPIALDIPLPVVATIALHMLYDSGWPLPAIAAILIVFSAAAQRFSARAEGRRGWIVAALILITFCSAAAALLRGRQIANQDMLDDSSTLPFVAFSTKWESAKSGLPD